MIEMKLMGLEDTLRLLQSLPAEIVSKRGGPVKLALAKGARFLRDHAKRNLQAAIVERGDESTGLLLKNVVASRGKPPQGVKGERYLVRVRRKTYPNTQQHKVTTIQTGSFLEYGTERQPATPWLRPAFVAYGQTAMTMIVTDLNKRIERIFKKLKRK